MAVRWAKACANRASYLSKVSRRVVLGWRGGDLRHVGRWEEFGDASWRWTAVKAESAAEKVPGGGRSFNGPAASPRARRMRETKLSWEKKTKRRRRGNFPAHGSS